MARKKSRQHRATSIPSRSAMILQPPLCTRGREIVASGARTNLRRICDARRTGPCRVCRRRWVAGFDRRNRFGRGYSIAGCPASLIGCGRPVRSPCAQPQVLTLGLALTPGLAFKSLTNGESVGPKSAACGTPPCRAYRPCWRRGRVAEGGGLLNRYRVVKPYRGFESLRLRHPSAVRPGHSRPPALSRAGALRGTRPLALKQGAHRSRNAGTAASRHQICCAMMIREGALAPSRSALARGGCASCAASPPSGRTCRRPSSSRSRSASARAHGRDWPGRETPKPRRQTERIERAFASPRLRQILWWNFGSCARAALMRSCVPAATNARSWPGASKRGRWDAAELESRAPAARSRAPR